MSEPGTGDNIPMPLPEGEGKNGQESMPMQGPSAIPSEEQQTIAFIQGLLSLPPDKREQLLATLSPDEQAEIGKVLKMIEGSGESLADRTGDQPEKEEIIDDLARKDLIDASKNFVSESEMPEEERTHHITTITDLYNKLSDKTATISEADIDTFAQELTSLKFRRDSEGNIDADILRFFPKLSPQQREAIIAKLPEITPAEKADRESVSESEAEKRDATINALGATAQTIGETGMQELDRDIESLNDSTDPQDKEKLALLNARKSKMNGLLTRVKDFFAEDTPGRKWAIRLGKIGYISLITLFLIIILEMNAINKMTRRK